MSFFGPPPTVLKRLTDGLDRRTALDTQFQLDLFNRILQLLRELQQCPGVTSAISPGTAGQLTITEAELAGFIQRLENPDNMGRDAIEDIVDPLYNISRDGDNTLRRTAPGGLPGSASGVLPRSRRNPPRGITGSPGSVATGPEAPGSYRPPSVFNMNSSSWFSRSAKPPVSDVSAGKPRQAGPDPFASAIESSNPHVNSYRNPPATYTPGRYSESLYDVEGGSRRKTRRARKYRNRT